jgi:hypothetical protein
MPIAMCDLVIEHMTGRRRIFDIDDSRALATQKPLAPLGAGDVRPGLRRATAILSR